jgi:hypothetical protein
MYSKAAALALAAGIPNAVVAHLSHDSADLVLVRDDLAKTVHRVSIPGVSDPEGSASVLAQAIDELTAFEVESLEDTAAREVDAVVLTGAMTTQPEVANAVRSMLGKRVRSVSPRVWYPDKFPASQYAINIGLALADWNVRSSSWRRSQGSRVRPTDLLPERHRVRTVPKKVTQVAAVSTAVATIVVCTVYGAGQARQDVAALQASVASLERQARIDAAQASRLNREQTQVTSILGQITAIGQMMAERQATVDEAIARLAAMTIDSEVRRVDPIDISHTQGKVSITAGATSINQALAYADALRQSGLFTTISVKDISAGAGAPGQGAGPITIMYTVNIEATYRDDTVVGKPPR